MSDDAPIALVTGATGLVGRRLIPALQREGFAVRALSRRAGNTGLPTGVEALEWNGRHVTSEALFRTRAIIHLAGEPVFGGRLTPQRKRRIRESRIESTRSIVASVSELPESDRPQVLVCASAVGYYGSRGDEVLEEAASPGDDFLAEVCVAWEAAAAEIEAIGLRRVSLRIGIVLAREGGALAGLRLPFSLGLGGRLGSGRQWFPWVHIDDLTRLLSEAVRDERYRGAVNATSPGIVTNGDLTLALGRALGRPTFMHLPAFAVRLALGELSAELLGSRRVTPRVAQERGFSFAYPALEEALAAELD